METSVFITSEPFEWIDWRENGNFNLSKFFRKNKLEMKILTLFENQPLLNYLALQSLLQKPVECSELTRDCRGRDHMVVDFTIFITESRGVIWIN